MTDTFPVPVPQTGWSREVAVLEGAHLVPPTESGLIQRCGVLAGDGRYDWRGSYWRKQRPMMTPPDAPPPETGHLAGRHFYCGPFWEHFGHFLCESLARLWAWPEHGAGCESLLFLSKRPWKQHNIRSWQPKLLAQFGIDVPIRIVSEPTRIDELVLPGPGFGLGALSAGTSEFVRFVHDHLAPDIRPDGAERLYLSRTALGGRLGGALLEARIEENLARHGYRIFHPERHSIEAQIAQFRAARQIVGLDGSAFHLLGFVARPDQQVAVIKRRTGTVQQYIVQQLQGFAGIEPVVIDTVLADWLPEARSKAARDSYGQLDFAALGAELAGSGFIDGDAGWISPPWMEVQLAVAEAEAKIGTPFTRSLTARGKAARKARAAVD